MKVIKNSIDQQLAEYCRDEIRRLQGQGVWQSSTLFWVPEIRNCIVGSCLAVRTGEDIKQAILTQVSSYLPVSASNIETLFYIWQPNSGISKHSDSGFKFGATIYLNSGWDIDWGGNFLYYNSVVNWDLGNQYQSDYQNWHVIVPEYRTMVLNDDQSVHLVTPISSLSPSLRYTIQIFGTQ